MNKEFDCVEMKHKAAEKIRKKIAGLTTKEELSFWNTQTKSLKKNQQKALEKLKVKPFQKH